MNDKGGLVSHLQQYGLPPMVDGPRVEHFNREELASAIEYELARATVRGQKKIVLTMDLHDAHLLSLVLRSEPHAGR